MLVITGGAGDAGAGADAAGVSALPLGTVTSRRAPLEPSMIVMVFCSTGPADFGAAGAMAGAIALGAIFTGSLPAATLASGASTIFAIGSPPSGSSLNTA